MPSVPARSSQKSNQGAASKTRITQREIGQHLGVSQTLVGYALNGNGRISEELRERIVSEAKRLGYVPNKAARALKSGRSQLVALWLPQGVSPFFGLILGRLQALAEADGYDLVTTSGRTPHLSQWPLDGVLLHDDSPLRAEQLQQARANNGLSLPIVAFGHQLHLAEKLSAYQGIDYVGVELLASSRLVVQSLIGSGCRSLAFIAASSISDGNEPRLKAFRDIVQNAGVKGKEIVIEDSAMLRQEARRVMDGLFAKKSKRFDGIFCGNDDVALGVLRSLRTHGVKVPGDVQVIGCDGLPDGADAEPPLSTIAFPFDELCASAWQTLRWRLDNPEAPPRRMTLQPQIVLRETTDFGIPF